VSGLERRIKPNTEHPNSAESLGDALFPDWGFIYRRIKGVSERRLEDAYHEAIIALLRSDVPLSRHTRTMLSNELVSLWWPTISARHRRKNNPRPQLSQPPPA
jgi:hypothetical protein